MCLRRQAAGPRPPKFRKHPIHRLLELDSGEFTKGNHTIILKVWDKAGNISSKSCRITIKDNDVKVYESAMTADAEDLFAAPLFCAANTDLTQWNTAEDETASAGIFADDALDLTGAVTKETLDFAGSLADTVAASLVGNKDKGVLA